MTKIYLKTQITAPIEKVFDLSRNIDFHIKSAQSSKEKAIAGTTTGIIELNETVTWKGKHFGLYLTHQSKITALSYPTYFIDEMIKGHFKSFKHQHIFNQTSYGTEMTDILEYETPYSFLGNIFNYLCLKKHLIQFLNSRNQSIKMHLEAKK
ncbi:SRPBCC family protein [Aquimarina sp. 2201CG5-10]|uniref:SRPBCC family protein n=1 Tax=Aquimarina callyspongiae TaxID=3098150 RepID=UPI002AB46C47|nr:SRPBCC family protein [Aquimarina sp. 2201CG5-10]MDY8134490.1 SRPBCC family protein [Aquimarina sp. 2201CG5-10]